jgi:hypothetical protein
MRVPEGTRFFTPSICVEPIEKSSAESAKQQSSGWRLQSSRNPGLKMSFQSSSERATQPRAAVFLCRPFRAFLPFVPTQGFSRSAAFTMGFAMPRFQRLKRSARRSRPAYCDAAGLRPRPCSSTRSIIKPVNLVRETARICSVEALKTARIGSRSATNFCSVGLVTSDAKP